MILNLTGEAPLRRPDGRMTVFEETRLADGAIAGDTEAVQALWRAHRRWIAAIVLAHMPRQADLDDLLQDVAVQLVRHVHTLKDPASVRPWLRTIAVNLARSAGRKARVVRRHLPLVAAQTGSTIETEHASAKVEAGEQGRRALELAQSLPPEYREPLLLRAVRGMSYRQIADVMGVPMTTIETRLARARRMLRDEMDALNETSPGAPQRAENQP